MNRPLVIAHRGASHGHADNSWAAFEGAVAEGADWIECDVQISADGVLVVRHDLTVGRTPIADLDVAEILRDAPETVRFDDLLTWRRRNSDVGLLVEIKDRAAVPALAVAIESEDPARIVVGGFDCIALRAFKARRPEMRTSLMLGSVLDARDMIDLARRYRADGVHPCWEARAPRASALVAPEDVAALHGAGLAVTLWHEERVEELTALVALGVDGICTDTPGVLRGIVG